MLAAVLSTPAPVASNPLAVQDVAMPQPGADEVLLRVRACGVCRTDLHIVEGELATHRSPLIPGHQIVGEVIEDRSGTHAPGTRVGVSWVGSTDQTCRFCLSGFENLCDNPVFTGYDRDGGYAQFTTARSGFVHPLPQELSDGDAAPLLCAGIIGFRALRIAGVQPGERVGLYGFGASAHLALAVLRSWNCEVYVSTRGESHRAFARELGAQGVGDALERPPLPLDRAITFAPSGDVVIAALSALRKGGVLAINAIHLDRMPQFDYDSLLWGERQIRSVTNMTRTDARDFIDLAARIRLRPRSTVFPLTEANTALQAVKNDAVDGAAVLLNDSMRAG